MSVVYSLRNSSAGCCLNRVKNHRQKDVLACLCLQRRPNKMTEKNKETSEGENTFRHGEMLCVEMASIQNHLQSYIRSIPKTRVQKYS